VAIYFFARQSFFMFSCGKEKESVQEIMKGKSFQNSRFVAPSTRRRLIRK
jgi:hypothetical protein